MYPFMSNLVIGVPFSGRTLPYKQLLNFQGWSSSVPMNYNCRQFYTVSAPIANARNYFCDEAIKCNGRFLFQWDEDVQVPPYALRQLVYHLEHHDDWALVGGIYCQKNEPERTIAPMVFKQNGSGPYWKWKLGELFEVDSMGFGCSLLRIEALKDIEKPWFATVRDFDASLDNIPHATLFSEDIWFCNQLKKTGKWKIFADGSIVCPHIDLATGKEYTLPRDSYPLRTVALPRGDKKILDIGCGTNPYKTNEGTVVTCDIRGDVGADYRCDFRKLPFATGEFDIVYSSHCLEHLPRGEVDDALKEWVRVVKPGGEIRLVIPNIAWAAEQIQKGVVSDDVMNVLYGSQEYPQNFHRVGFTPQTLTAMLKAIKLKVRLEDTKGYNIIIAAVKDGVKPKKAKPGKKPKKK